MRVIDAYVLDRPFLQSCCKFLRGRRFRKFGCPLLGIEVHLAVSFTLQVSVVYNPLIEVHPITQAHPGLTRCNPALRCAWRSCRLANSRLPQVVTYYTNTGGMSGNRGNIHYSVPQFPLTC